MWTIPIPMRIVARRFFLNKCSPLDLCCLGKLVLFGWRCLQEIG